MTKLPTELLKKKIEELETITTVIAAMDLTNEWKERFTVMSFYRNWRKLDTIKQSKLINIAKVNSPAIATIVEQTNTKLSLSRIEKIAMIVTDEQDREKIKQHLLTRSWEDAKKDVDLIISSYEDK